ncbi:lipopolysaccharide biosynthesis protein [Natronomonas amylolytica]|uniref:lipopolysaccharide biosynthesis protein n=1 Tax=Natronomonas amylolytica TaxID=3108498 RepID=UPI00300B80C5
MAEPSDDTDEIVFDSLESVTHGAVVNGGGVFTQRMLQFIVNFALTQGLPVALFGVYSLGDRIIRLLSRFSPLGSDQSVVRFLPEYDDSTRRNHIIGIAYVTAGVVSGLIAAGMFVLAPIINTVTLEHPSFVGVIRLFALMLPAFTFIRLFANIFRTLELVEYQTLLLRVGIPAARLVAVLVAFVLGYSVFGIVGAITLTTTVLAALSFGLILQQTDLRAGQPTLGESWEFYNHAVPSAASRVGLVLRSRVDVLLIGWLLTAEAAGIYNIALFLTGFITLPLIAFNSLLPAVASDLYTDGEYAVLQSMYSAVTRWIVTVTLPIALILLIYRVELLGVFGSAFTHGSMVVAVFVIGRVIAAAVGATGWLLLMTDHQYLRMVNSWGLGILNIGLSYYLVLRLGLVGAALGTAGSLAFINVLRLGQLWYLEDLQPFTRKYLKPVVAAVGMAAAMVAFRPLLEGVVLLVVGAAVGVAVFVTLLCLLGIDPRDYRLFATLFEQYRPSGTVKISRRSD